MTNTNNGPAQRGLLGEESCVCPTMRPMVLLRPTGPGFSTFHGAGSPPPRFIHMGAADAAMDSRRKPNTACLECRKGHFRCEGQLPCKRCNARGIACEPLGAHAAVQRLERSIVAISHEVNQLRILRCQAAKEEQLLLTKRQESESFEAFHRLAEVANDLLLHPERYDVLFPVLVGLESRVVGTPESGLPLFLYKSLQLNMHLFRLFSVPQTFTLSQTFRNKAIWLLHTFSAHLHCVDQAFLSRVLSTFGVSQLDL